MSDDDARAGEELARSWLQGKSEMSDDLALLVSGMTQPLDEMAKAFLQTIGSAARLSAKSKGRPASARIEAQPSAQPTPEPPPSAPVDLNEMLRRRRERDRARRLEEFGRSNADAWRDQAEMVRGMGAGVVWS
jgi:hypothetical protein